MTYAISLTLSLECAFLISVKTLKIRKRYRASAIDQVRAIRAQRMSTCFFGALGQTLRRRLMRMNKGFRVLLAQT